MKGLFNFLGKLLFRKQTGKVYMKYIYYDWETGQQYETRFVNENKESFTVWNN